MHLPRTREQELYLHFVHLWEQGHRLLRIARHDMDAGAVTEPRVEELVGLSDDLDRKLSKAKELLQGYVTPGLNSDLPAIQIEPVWDGNRQDRISFLYIKCPFRFEQVGVKELGELRLRVEPDFGGFRLENGTHHLPGAQPGKTLDEGLAYARQMIHDRLNRKVMI